ncbi:MAG: asparagine synthetase B [Sphingobacteriales bacterium]|nr:MAG: asparagine synthetase B [Sphingobacteriales bacterium]
MHFLASLCLYVLPKAKQAYLLIPMDDAQKNHLKAYGIAYWSLTKDIPVDWLLNYRGGSFAIQQQTAIEKECLIRNVSYELIADAKMASILEEISNPEINMDVVRLEKAPKVAVYSPKTNNPWDDAVTLALTYAEIPYDVIYDEEILDNKLPLYDWLHLHHEDFTGQYGKFWASYQNADWYINQVADYELRAKKLGFSKVSDEKRAVALKVRDFVLGGGFMFAMCSATDSYDIALATNGIDICEHMFDGDGMDPHAQQKIDYSKSFAFQNYVLSTTPWEYEYSSIDALPLGRDKNTDYFTLFDFSAKWDQVPAMLTQNHEKLIKGFMGQTTAFRNNYIKADVLILGENKSLNEAKYIHGTNGKGTWTFYGGHDPEDYQHRVGDPPTDLNLHPNSPGYRLILNNILFPAAKKKKQKT